MHQVAHQASAHICLRLEECGTYSTLPGWEVRLVHRRVAPQHLIC